MKKILFIFTMFAAAATVNAQETTLSTEEAVVAEQSQAESFKPEEGSIEMEVGFAPFSVNNDGVRLQGGELKGAYILNEQFKIRLGLGFATNKEVNKAEGEWPKTTTSTSRFSITPGFTYSFDGTDKLDPFVGAELMFATESNKRTVEQESGDKTVTKNQNSPFNVFGIGALTGFNYYFAKNLFVGVEVGIGVEFGSEKNRKVETTTNGQTTTTENKTDNSSFDFRAYANPSIRLGWVF